nr:MAG TPA: hypothetical protein [Caudoviricetes sp.]
MIIIGFTGNVNTIYSGVQRVKPSVCNIGSCKL